MADQAGIRFTTVQALYDAGFPVGPGPDESCLSCMCRWGDHTLCASGSPLDGGTYGCPYCLCLGTWCVTDAEAVKNLLTDEE